jgi:ribosomal protein S18 acetylase RimI-like enzyme
MSKLEVKRASFNDLEEIKQIYLGNPQIHPPSENNYLNNDSIIFCIKRSDQILGYISGGKNEWESEHFGFKIGKINDIVSLTDNDREYAVKKELISVLSHHYNDEQFRCIASRVQASDISSIHALEKNGYNLIDSICTLRYDHTKCSAANETEILHRSDLTIRGWQNRDLETLAAIAGDIYSHDRFHSDPHFEHEECDELHEKWIVNCCQGISDEVLIAEDNNGMPIGFITCKTVGRRGVIDLVGVSPRSQRRGVGSLLLGYSIDWFKGKVDYIDVGTQCKNVSAMRLYIKNGFLPVSASLTFHKWYGAE